MKKEIIFDPNVAKELEAFFLTLFNYSKKEKELIKDAACWGSHLHRFQKRASGEPYYIHPIEVAKILVGLKMDCATIIASLLHDVEEDTEIGREEIISRYGDEVEKLVNAVTKITLAEADNDAKDIKNDIKQKTLQKISIAMAKDVRVIIIKLADKLHNMATLSFKKQEKQFKTAKECLDIFVPLANKLGIFYFKSMLEDLALTHIDSEMDKNITSYKQNQAEKYHTSFLSFSKNIYEAISDDFFIDIKESISSNYAIYCLLKEQGGNIDSLQIPLRVDIICDTNDHCYRILGLVHSIYKPLSGHIKDFIASPKENHYQAIHTEIMDFYGLVLEIKIKTVAMDRRANFGVVSYWLFNEKQSFNSKNIQLLKQIESWESNNMGSEEFEHSITKDLHYKLINIFSKDGHLYHVGKNFTVLDFIMHYYQDKFWLLSNVTINNKQTNLNESLHSNQVINPIFSNQETIELKWISMVNTSFSQSLIKNYYKKQGLFINNYQDIILLLDENIDKNFKLQFCHTCGSDKNRNDIKAIVNRTDKTISLHSINCIKLKDKTFFSAYYHEPSLNIFAYSIEIKDTQHFLKDLHKILHKFSATLLYFKLDNLVDYKKIVYIRIASSLNHEDVLRIETNLRKISCVIGLNKELLK